jgi:hypothetical protein
MDSPPQSFWQKLDFKSKSSKPNLSQAVLPERCR